jgi:hypothetical protein
VQQAPRNRERQDDRPLRFSLLQLPGRLGDRFRQLIAVRLQSPALTQPAERAFQRLHVCGVIDEPQRLRAEHADGELSAAQHLLEELENAGLERSGAVVVDEDGDLHGGRGRLQADDRPFLAPLLDGDLRGRQIGDRGTFGIDG